MKTVTVDASKKYDITIGYDILASVGERLSGKFGGCKITLVTDSRVDTLYSKTVIDSLSDNGFSVEKFVFPEGEKSKNKDVLFELLEFLAEKRMTRNDLLIALGGGVVGDMTGFAAACYLRGIRFVQIPTTLLACVDSSVGGKTGINLEHGKNLAGAFWQPEAVFCDLKTLDTLDEKIFSDGMAEVIKYGVIADRELFDTVKNGGLRNNAELLENVVARCVSIKRDIVNEDERENGVRKLLNFGHTVGHAVEKCSDFKVSHGSAVAVGMVIAARAAYKNGLSETDCSDEIIKALIGNGLPVSCDFSAEKLSAVALSDKKMSMGNVSFIVPEKIGKCKIVKIGSLELISFIGDGLE
ncbi:MAG: 3-dehydroquinate synthase [Clostridiales bacterium]|nr:3-dehydroquinate synthase [Clostridia bacterium]MCR4563383.1 3-dehydroquinate synthase [Clostridiales bacterium]